MDAWNAIRDAGADFGILPYGLDTLDSLRFEKGYIFYGYEVTDKNNPFECGLDRWIAFEKGDFVRKEALLEIREIDPEKRLMAIEMEDDSPVAEELTVEHDGNIVGETIV